MKLVVLSQRVDNYPERGESRDALDQRVYRFVAACGYLPVAVPNALIDVSNQPDERGQGLDDWLARLQPDAVILSGGGNLGQHPLRDNTEQRLLDWAATKRAPVLGICRGMQLMAVTAGASLVPVTGHVRTRHGLSGEITGTVNSFHNFALDACPKGYRVIARADDGMIEAIRHEHLSWEGWMWHPEREEIFRDADLSRVRDLFGE